MGLAETLGGITEFLGDSISAIGSMFGFLFDILGMVTFFLSEPTLILMAIFTFALSMAIMRSKNVFDFVSIVIDICFKGLNGVFKIVFGILNAVFNVLKVLSNLIPFT